MMYRSTVVNAVKANVALLLMRKRGVNTQIPTDPRLLSQLEEIRCHLSRFIELANYMTRVLPPPFSNCSVYSVQRVDDASISVVNRVTRQKSCLKQTTPEHHGWFAISLWCHHLLKILRMLSQHLILTVSEEHLLRDVFYEEETSAVSFAASVDVVGNLMRRNRVRDIFPVVMSLGALEKYETEALETTRDAGTITAFLKRMEQLSTYAHVLSETGAVWLDVAKHYLLSYTNDVILRSKTIVCSDVEKNEERYKAVALAVAIHYGQTGQLLKPFTDKKVRRSDEKDEVNPGSSSSSYGLKLLKRRRKRRRKNLTTSQWTRVLNVNAVEFDADGNCRDAATRAAMSHTQVLALAEINQLLSDTSFELSTSVMLPRFLLRRQVVFRLRAIKRYIQRTRSVCPNVLFMFCGARLRYLKLVQSKLSRNAQALCLFCSSQFAVLMNE